MNEREIGFVLGWVVKFDPTEDIAPPIPRDWLYAGDYYPQLILDEAKAVFATRVRRGGMLSTNPKVDRHVIGLCR